MSNTAGIYETIVVGTDGSERAGVAVRHAIALAKASGAKLHAIHVVHPAVTIGFSDTAAGQYDIDQMRRETDRAREQLMAAAKAEGVSAEMHNPTGDPADAIIDFAKSVKADLIVLGNRGMTGVARFVLGSIPNKVSHQCPCSILIVKTDGDET